MSPKIKTIATIAERYGYRAYRGRWVKEWPSGIQWSFEFDGTVPRIEDRHGRTVRDTQDGISYLGMLLSV